MDVDLTAHGILQALQSGHLTSEELVFGLLEANQQDKSLPSCCVAGLTDTRP